VNEVFDIPPRGGLIAVGSTENVEFTGIPDLRDEVTGRPIHILGVDHPTRGHAAGAKPSWWWTERTPTSSAQAGAGRPSQAVQGRRA